MNKVKLNLFICLFAAINFGRYLYSQDIPRFEIFELTLTASGNYSNPYLQMPDDTTAPGFVEGIFTGPNNESINIDGFWYGGQTWKIRMAPLSEGTWTYITSSGDQGLNGISGSFNCVSSNNHGFIIKNPENPYAFAYTDGTPYFWMGDHEQIFYDHSEKGVTNYNFINGTFQSLYDTRNQQGFTSIYFGTMLYEKRGNFKPNEGGYNFLNSDPDSLNPLFWQAADDRVSFMCDSVGILPGIGLGWPDQGIKSFGDARLIRGLRYLIARYAAYNVMWNLLGEANETVGWQAWVRKFGMTVKKYDPYDHLTSTLLTQTASGTAWVGGESWSDMVIHQFDASDNLISKLTTDRQYDKPVINVEFDWQNSYDVRRKDAWKIMTNGGWAGYGTENATERHEHFTQGLLYMQYLQQFFTQTRYWLLQPYNEYVISGTGYCTALPDTEYVVYLPAGGSIGLDLSGASGIFDVEWYNPRDGSTTVVSAVNGGGSVNFASSDNNDWTLHLTKQSNDISENIKVYLEGPYDATGDSMKTTINDSLPLSQPYNASPWNYAGTESVTSMPDSIVDWVLVELRTGTADSTAVDTVAALLTSKGKIINTSDGGPAKSQVAAGDYYIVIHHRNHLAVMSANSQALSGSSTLYDFTTGLSQYYGGDAKQLETGVYGMYAGDGNQSGIVTIADRNDAYIDRDSIGYLDTDYNLSGIVTISDVNIAFINRDASSQVP